MRQIKNASLLLIVFVACLFIHGCGDGRKKPKNLVIVMIDALRRDHLGGYGYNRDTSPNIDKFASQSLIVDNAVSQSGWTAPSIIALFSSDYPRSDLNDSRTFAQWLKKKNYQTAAFASNPILLPQFGYDKGFDVYHKKDWAEGKEIVNWTLEQIEKRDKEKPFCFYLHFMDVHDPYSPSQQFAEKFSRPYDGLVNGHIKPYKKQLFEKQSLELSRSDIQRLVDLYDADIATVDHEFARLIAGLKKAGVYNDSIIVVVADHGDEFMEHGGVGHGHSVFDELIRVPLIIGGVKHLSGKRYTGLFELIDLAPTLADLMNVSLPYKTVGRSFAGNLAENLPMKKMVFSEIHRTAGLMAGKWFVSARTMESKLIFDPHRKQYDFFDLTLDREEQTPLKALKGNQMPVLLKTLRQWRKVFGSTGKRKAYNPEAMNALRSLGYL